MDTVKLQHFKPETISDWLAFWTLKLLMLMVNIFSGYVLLPMTEAKWVNRSFMMETISMIPGMVASICRYLRSLSLIKKDKGWIHHLIEESDN